MKSAPQISEAGNTRVRGSRYPTTTGGTKCFESGSKEGGKDRNQVSSIAFLHRILKLWNEFLGGWFELQWGRMEMYRFELLRSLDHLLFILFVLSYLLSPSNRKTPRPPPKSSNALSAASSATIGDPSSIRYSTFT